MVAVTKSFKVGEGNEEGVFLGPIQNKMQYEKVKVRLLPSKPARIPGLEIPSTDAALDLLQ